MTEPERTTEPLRTTEEESSDEEATAEERPWFQVGADSVRLLRDGAEAFPAMLEAISRAEREVLLEMYWIGADSCGERFRDALLERARAGVKVKVIYDAVGSLGISDSFWQPLRSAGGDIREYHALFPLAHTGILP